MVEAVEAFGEVDTDLLQRAGTGPDRDAHVVSVPGQRQLETAPDQRVVLDEQNRHHVCSMEVPVTRNGPGGSLRRDRDTAAESPRHRAGRVDAMFTTRISCSALAVCC